MDITSEVKLLVGKPESEVLEYKAVLPPSRNVAQTISSFANSKGGYIILGVAETQNGLSVNGLSEDFHANAIIHKAIDLLSPIPQVYHQYVLVKGKRVYAIKVEQSNTPISLEGKIFKRVGEKTILENPQQAKVYNQNGYSRLAQFSLELEGYKDGCTSSKLRIIEHYQSILNILDDLKSILYPVSPNDPTENREGRILERILFSSCADNFETYLSELLFEIYLAKPETLKSDEKSVSIKEILECADIQDFINYWAKKKLSKLQKGSVKAFISDNVQIKGLNAISVDEQGEIEKILQIRHLYAHRNGIIDEKFQKYFPNSVLNSEYRMSVAQMLDKLGYLVKVVNQIDSAAMQKYRLASSN